MKQLRLLLREVHRRSVWHTLAVFIGGGWATLQVIDLFIGRGFAPEWVFCGALVVLAIGLPVVLTTAFMQGGRERAPAAAQGVFDVGGRIVLADFQTRGAAHRP